MESWIIASRATGEWTTKKNASRAPNTIISNGRFICVNSARVATENSFRVERRKPEVQHVDVKLSNGLKIPICSSKALKL